LRGEAVGLSCSLVYQHATSFDQMLYQAGLFGIRLQTAQAGAMMHQKIQ